MNKSKSIKIIIIFLLMILYNHVNAQSGTLSNIGDSIKNLHKANLIITKYYYNNEPNIQILKIKDEFYKIEYYDSGEKKSESKVAIMLLTDVYYDVSLNSDSLTNETIRYSLDISLNGRSEEFYKNGSLASKGKYIWGKKEGTWKYYNPKGKIIKKEKWKYGKLLE